MVIAPHLSVERGKRDKESRQRMLIEGATVVFAERGFDAATTREIAERSECSEGLIHRYFGGKRGLMMAILQSKAQTITEELTASVPERDDLHDELSDLLLWHLDLMWERRDFMRVAMTQAALDPEIGRTISRGINKERVQNIVKRLRRHQTAGRIRLDVDIEAAAQAIAGIGYATGYQFQVILAGDRSVARRIAREAASAFSRGLMTDSTRRRNT